MVTHVSTPPALQNPSSKVVLKTLGSRRRPWDERPQLFDSVVISQWILHQVSVMRKCSLRASPCARVKLLRGFWDRGRVCGDRSVFVTSHRPAHSSRAHLFSVDRILHFAFEVISACPPSTPLHLHVFGFGARQNSG